MVVVGGGFLFIEKLLAILALQDSPFLIFSLLVILYISNLAKGTIVGMHIITQTFHLYSIMISLSDQKNTNVLIGFTPFFWTLLLINNQGRKFETFPRWLIHWFSKCLWTSTMSITWELVTNILRPLLRSAEWETGNGA